MKVFNMTMNKLFSFQAVLTSNFKHFRPLSTMQSSSDITSINSFWFDHPDPVPRWFMANATLDNEIKENFGSLVQQARASSLTTWTSEPKGTLALLLLLDQFPRNLHRGSPLSYSSDHTASAIAVEAIAKGQDRQVDAIQQSFFYLPLMHGEDLKSQVAGVALYEGLVARTAEDADSGKMARSGLNFAERHRDVIMKFGRFPSRNEALGRTSTEEEKEFLKENPNGFTKG